MSVEKVKDHDEEDGIAGSEMSEIPPDCCHDLSELRMLLALNDTYDLDTTDTMSFLSYETRYSDHEGGIHLVSPEEDRDSQKEDLRTDLMKLDALKNSLPLNLSAISLLQLRIGLYYHRHAEYKFAVEYLIPALETNKKFSLPNNLISAILHHIGVCYLKMGNDSQNALKHLSQALEIEKEILPAERLGIAILYGNIGRTYIQMENNHQKAVQYFEQSLGVYKLILAIDDLRIASANNNIGIGYFGLGNNQRAVEYYECALEIRKKILPVNHLDIATLYNNIGHAYLGLGNKQKALEYYTQAVDIIKNPYHPEGVDITHTSTKLAQLKLKIDEQIQKADCAARAAAVSLAAGASAGDASAQEEDVSMKDAAQNQAPTDVSVMQAQPADASGSVDKGSSDKIRGNAIEASAEAVDQVQTAKGASTHLKLLDILQTMGYASDNLSLDNVKETFQNSTYQQILQNKEILSSYAQDAFDNKTIEEYPYALVVLVCLRHICDNYDGLCDSVYTALKEQWINSDQYTLDIRENAIDWYDDNIGKQKHSSLTLEKWQRIYNEKLNDLDTLQYQMHKSIEIDKVHDISAQCLDNIKLPKAFSIEALKQIKDNYPKLQDLYDNIKDRDFGTVMRHSCSLLYSIVYEMEEFTNYFEKEANLAGGIEEYFGELDGSA